MHPVNEAHVTLSCYKDLFNRLCRLVAAERYTPSSLNIQKHAWMHLQTRIIRRSSTRY